MKNTLPLLFLLCFLVQSCNNNKSNNDAGVVIPNAYKKVARLEENLTMVGEILSFDFINEEDFIISTRKPSSVILYGPSGQQKSLISKVGQGPYEFLEPDIVKFFNEHIYVWCPSQLKLIKYSLDGTPIQEYSGFSK